MQRLFSVFPRGWPGIGLLLLRISVAGAAVVACAGCEDCTDWLLVGLIPLCVSLGIGALTPLAAILAVGLELTAAANLWLSGSGLVVTTIIDAAALALLGPGAYSLDARRFGRRLILAQSSRDGDSE